VHIHVSPITTRRHQHQSHAYERTMAAFSLTFANRPRDTPNFQTQRNNAKHSDLQRGSRDRVTFIFVTRWHLRRSTHIAPLCHHFDTYVASKWKRSACVQPHVVSWSWHDSVVANSVVERSPSWV